MHPTEQEIWNLLRLLSKIDDGEAAAFANAAADNLRSLVGTGIFGSLTGQSQALMEIIANDPAIKESDREVAKVLLTACDPVHGYANLSKQQISIRIGFQRDQDPDCAEAAGRGRVLHRHSTYQNGMGRWRFCDQAPALFRSDGGRRLAAPEPTPKTELTKPRQPAGAFSSKESL